MVVQYFSCIQNLGMIRRDRVHPIAWGGFHAVHKIQKAFYGCYCGVSGEGSHQFGGTILLGV